MKKVITYGTFDLFHQGHYNILKRAKEQGDYLVVGVTSESYDIERGKLSVRDSLSTRIKNVQDTGFADEIIIEEYLGQKIQDVMKHKIDTLVIGSDWLGKFDHLKDICDVVYLERTKDISSTQIREESSKTYKIGIATDKLNDKQVIEESKYVSGIHFEGVYSEDEILGKEFEEKYELDFSSSDYNSFLDKVDFVYINCALEKRVELINKALDRGKHIISDSPFTFNVDEHKSIYEKAREKKLIFIENIVTLYLRAFTQIQWMTQGDIVGDNISIKCSATKEDLTNITSDTALINLCIATILKINGTDVKNVHKKRIGDEKTGYTNVLLEYENSLGIIEIGSGVSVQNGLTIIGKEATVYVSDNWWDSGYFELKKHGESQKKRYSFNFEGSGFRYVLQEIMLLLRDGILENPRLFQKESLAMLEVLNEIRE